MKKIVIPSNWSENITYIKNDNIPKLSWCAKIYNGKTIINYGQDVIKHGNGIFEGVWDGEFNNLNYIDANHVFGSGITEFDKNIIFTPPSHMYECIFCVYEKKTTSILFSNSLSFILSLVEYNNLLDLVEKVRVNNDKLTSAGVLDFDPLLYDDENITIYGFYYHNISISQNEIKILLRENITKFNNYNEYYSYLSSTIEKLITNGSDKNRVVDYTAISTISKGYDSPAVSSILNNLGEFKAVTIDVDVYGVNDSGNEIANILNMPCYQCQHPLGNSISNLGEIEYPEDFIEHINEFIATTGLGDDLVFLAFDKFLSNKLIFTGALGDIIWDANENPTPYGIPVRIPFGKSLNEYRLRKGFTHIPLPVIGAVFPRYIYRINFLHEMDDYNICSNYNRPIPRRMIEESGVCRQLFAKSKNATNPNPINLKKFKNETFLRQIAKYSFIQ